MFCSDPEIWFDDVDEILLERKPKKTVKTDPVTTTDTSKTDEQKESKTAKDPLVKDDAFKG